jgi:hypothetical protein
LSHEVIDVQCLQEIGLIREDASVETCRCVPELETFKPIRGLASPKRERRMGFVEVTDEAPIANSFRYAETD